MKEIVRFFWERWKAACQVDAANKILGRFTNRWTASEEWISAYKATLSKTKQQEFDKEWNILESYLTEWHNASPKKQTNMKNPFDK